MTAEWLDQRTSTHQDHVIAHVIGASVLGYFVHEEAAHLLLDIGFFWTILLDGEMGLVTRSVAIAELEIDDAARALLSEDVERLRAGLAEEVEPLAMMTAAPPDALITEVSFYACGERRLITVECESARLLIETSLSTREVGIEAETGDAA